MRAAAGLTQHDIAMRMGTTQSAVARLERDRLSPTVETLARALDATGHQLVLSATPLTPGVDESLIRQHLELSPAERLAGLESMAREAHSLAAAGRRARGEDS